MVLIHGVGLRAEAWNRMLTTLEQFFSVAAVDLPGHGKSEAFQHDQPVLSDYTDRLADVLNTLDAPAIVVGHSMGALIAIELAKECPEQVSAIAPLNAIFRRPEAAAKAVRLRALDIQKLERPNPSSTLERWFGSAPKGDLKIANDECRNWLMNVDQKGYSQAYTVFANENGPSGATLAGIRCPAHFITGSEEQNSTPAMSRSLAAEVGLGRASIVEGAGHMMPMTHANEVCELLTAYFDEMST